MEQIPKLLDRLHIDYTFSKNRYFFSCPVHGGDNPTGCTIFSDDNLCWKCWTGGCHEQYGSGIFGFVRGALTKLSNKNVTYDQVTEFIGSKYCKISIPVDEEVDPYRDTHRILNEFRKEPNRNYPFNIDRNWAIKNLSIPSLYFMGRCFTEEILIKFDVGDCIEGPESTNYMEGRAVTPVYNEFYQFVGSGGRLIDEESSGPKWLYDSILEKGQHLYGLNLSKQYILDSGVAIVVEGQGNVWRLWEAGYPNCVALMGSSLTDSQLILLEKSGCTTMVIMTDIDNAGQTCCKKIQEICGRRFNYVVPTMIKNDPAEHIVSELQIILTENNIKGIQCEF